MNISPVNAYGNQPKAYAPRFQGSITEYQNLPQKKSTTKKVLLWSGLGLGIVAVAAFLLKGKGIRNLFKKPTSPEIPTESAKPKAKTSKGRTQKRKTPQTPSAKTETSLTVSPLKDTNAPKITEAIEIPLKDTNAPKVSKLSRIETECNVENAGKSIKSGETGLTYLYDQKGFVISVFDANGKTLRAVYRNANGFIHGYLDYVRDANGNTMKIISRRADGSIKEYVNYIYDSNGRFVKASRSNA